jgi:hypothetical protein
MTPEQRGRLAAAYRDLMAIEKIKQGLLASLIPPQRAFAEDDSRFKAALCTRRAGKSYVDGILLFLAALSMPNCRCLYVALTRPSAKDIMWIPVLEEIARKHRIDKLPGYEVNNSELSITLPNGSRIKLMGLDSTMDERRKILGQKYRLVVVDEAQDFHSDLESIVYRDLKPALADHRGSVCLTGTPGDVRNFFYEITASAEEGNDDVAKGWTVHRWSALENPAVHWQEEIDSDIVLMGQEVEQTAYFKQQRLGQWAFDSTIRCYPSWSKIERVAALPDLRYGERWTGAVGVDYGYNDDFAGLVVKWRTGDDHLYVVRSQKWPGLDAIDQARQALKLAQDNSVSRVIGDSGGGGKGINESLRRRFQINVENADKHDKEQHMRLLDADIGHRKIVLVGEHPQLSREMNELVWDRQRYEASGTRAEDPRCHNHLTDALLYVWRKCYHYRGDVDHLADRPEEDPGQLMLVQALKKAAAEKTVGQPVRPGGFRRWGSFRRGTV